MTDSSARPIVILRHPQVRTHFYDVVLLWARDMFPELLRRVEVCDLPCLRTDWRGVRLLVSWLQDPVQDWSVEIYEQVLALTEECEARGIAALNRVDRLVNAGKCRAAALLTDAGLHTPRMTRISNAEKFRRDFCVLDFPLFVREDWGHGQPMQRADTPEQARGIVLENFQRPVATQWMDVRDPRDGLFHKYRYLACGRHGISHHVQVSTDWITRGENRVINDATQAEELRYIGARDYHHAHFQRGLAALELDMAAFDYGLRIPSQAGH